MHWPSLVSELSISNWMARPRLRWPRPFLAEALGDVRILVERVDHFGQGFDALFAGHFAGGQLHGLDGGEFFRARQTAEHHGHRGGVVQVGVLVQGFAGQRGARLVADGVGGQILLHLVIGVVRNVADAAAVHDGRLLFFGQEAVELRVVAGGDDQRVDGPLVAVDLDVAVLDHPQVDLHQILLVFVDFVGEVDAAAGHARQGAAAQVESVGVVGVGDVQQALDRFFAQKIHGRRGDFVLGRILAGDGAQAFGERHRHDLHEGEHFFQIAVGNTRGCRSRCSRCRRPAAGSFHTSVSMALSSKPNARPR